MLSCWRLWIKLIIKYCVSFWITDILKLYVFGKVCQTVRRQNPDNILRQYINFPKGISYLKNVKHYYFGQWHRRRKNVEIGCLIVDYFQCRDLERKVIDVRLACLAAFCVTSWSLEDTVRKYLLLLCLWCSIMVTWVWRWKTHPKCDTYLQSFADVCSN